MVDMLKIQLKGFFEVQSVSHYYVQAATVCTDT